MLRVTPAEKSKIEQNAKLQRKRTANFLRELGLGASPKFSADDASEMRLHLGRIGSNLNQIAHACNTALLVNNASGVDLSGLSDAIEHVRMAERTINGLEKS